MIYRKPSLRSLVTPESLCVTGSSATAIGAGGLCSDGNDTTLDACNVGGLVGGIRCTYGSDPATDCWNGGLASGGGCRHGISPGTSDSSCSGGVSAV